MSSIYEISDAVRVIENIGNHKIVLLHCVSVYPPDIKDINLMNIEMLQDTFGYPVGFSDHTLGVEISIASIALGARVIEKHFTIDKSLDGGEHSISANPSEFCSIVKASHSVPSAIGSKQRLLSERELEMRNSHRRSMVASRDLSKGSVITKDYIDFRRPGTGITPAEYTHYLGRVLNRDVKSGWMIKREDID
jgi:sialic acid synthase SpsE